MSGNDVFNYPEELSLISEKFSKRGRRKSNEELSPPSLLKILLTAGTALLGVALGVGMFLANKDAPSNLHGQSMLAARTISGLFIAFGVFMAVLAWFGFGKYQRYKRLIRSNAALVAHRDFWWNVCDSEFDARKIALRHTASGAVVLLIFGTPIFVLFILPALGGDTFLVMPALMFSLGLAFILVIYGHPLPGMIWRALNHSGGKITWKDFPLGRGGEITLKWRELAKKPRATPVGATLRCVIENNLVVEAYGKKSEQTMQAVFKEFEAKVTGTTGEGTISVFVPDDTPPTRIWGGSPRVFWELELRVKTPRGVFSEFHKLPIY